MLFRSGVEVALILVLDVRDFYALDRLWRDCPVVPVDLDETP